MRTILLFLIATLPAAVRAASVESLRDPRPASVVLDVTSTLSAGDVQAIDSLRTRIPAGGELMVAVVDTTGGIEPRTFATELFNRWGIGDSQTNRGVLLLAALSDRKAEIIVGDGFGGDVLDITDQIMAEVVVAHFKRGDPRGAMVEGARALASRAFGAGAPPATGTPSSGAPAGPPGQLSTFPGSESAPSSSGTLSDFVEEYPVAAWGGGGAALFAGWLGVRRYLRRRPKTCKTCGQKMELLDEAADDAYLEPGQKVEERIGSVDYDVWLCPGCATVLTLRYGAFFTAYSKCSGCGAKTLKTESTTITPATEYSTGLARVTETCEHCSFRNSYNRTIPRRPKPSSSGYRSSSRSGGSSFSSGGGRSSGRGSSGGW